MPVQSRREFEQTSLLRYFLYNLRKLRVPSYVRDDRRNSQGDSLDNHTGCFSDGGTAKCDMNVHSPQQSQESLERHAFVDGYAIPNGRRSQGREQVFISLAGPANQMKVPAVNIVGMKNFQSVKHKGNLAALLECSEDAKMDNAFLDKLTVPRCPAPIQIIGKIDDADACDAETA